MIILRRLRRNPYWKIMKSSFLLPKKRRRNL